MSTWGECPYFPTSFPIGWREVASVGGVREVVALWSSRSSQDMPCCRGAASSRASLQPRAHVPALCEIPRVCAHITKGQHQHASAYLWSVPSAVHLCHIAGFVVFAVLLESLVEHTTGFEWCLNITSGWHTYFFGCDFLCVELNSLDRLLSLAMGTISRM